MNRQDWNLAATNPRNDGHRGFTLIELLVVIAMIAVLATMTIAFMPNAASSERESRAAVQLQGWLNIAKQKALRDQAPRGLRLWIVAPPGAVVTGVVPVPGAVTDCQYIEQPEDYAVGTIQTGAAPNILQVNNADFTNGEANQIYWTVQPGDYLEVMGTGLMHQIQAVNPTTPQTITIVPPLPYLLPAPGTSNYRIIRAPRPVGEETLKMPDGTLIDLGTNMAFPPYTNPLPLDPSGGFLDILFSPSGQVISRGVTTANINLWVRAPSNDAAHALDPFQGAPTVVSIFVRTGFVGAFPPARPPNPYATIH